MDIFEDLRHRLEHMRRFACRRAVLREHGQNLQRRDHAVAGGGEIVEHDVARLLAADIEAALHIFSMT